MTEPEKAEGLAATIQELFHNPGWRSAMGERGRSYALKHWDETRVLTSLESHLLMASGASPRSIAEEPVSMSL